MIIVSSVFLFLLDTQIISDMVRHVDFRYHSAQFRVPQQIYQCE